MTIIKNEIILLSSGEQCEANAKVNGHSVQFTRVSVGDANSLLPPLDVSRTSLDNHITDGDIVSHVVDPDNNNQRILQLRIGPDADYDARELLIYVTVNGVEYPHSYIRLGSPYPVRKSESGGAQILIDATIRVSSETDFNVNVLPGTDYISRSEFENSNHNFNISINSKLGKTATAVNSSKLAGQGPDYYKDIVARLGYQPIQQGGGANQSDTKVYIGWGDNGRLRVQVNNTDFGHSWPIDVSSASYLNGKPASYYAKASDVQTPVPAGAVFTDTWRPISDSLSSSSTTVSASVNGLRLVYSEAVAAQNAASEAYQYSSIAHNKIDTRVPKNDVAHYYTTGDVTVNFNHARKHIVTRWGPGDGVVTTTGDLLPGDELIINNIRDDSGTVYITGKRMYTGINNNSELTHTLSGKAKCTMVAYGAGGLMIAEVV